MLELKRYFAERVMQPFHAGVFPTTRAMGEFKERDFVNSYMWVKGRIVDDVELLLGQWRQERNENRIALPVCLMGVRNDFTSSEANYARPMATPSLIQVEEGGAYKELQVSRLDRTVQIVFVGATEAVTRSLAMQFCLYISRPMNRRFNADYDTGDGKMDGFPCVLEDNSLMPEPVEIDQKNISIHKIDIRIHESVPFFGEEIGVVSEVSINES